MVRPNLGFWRQLIHFEQLTKGNSGSVRIVRDEAQPDKLLPDVYIKDALSTEGSERPEAIFADESRERTNSGGKRIKFTPILQPLVEIPEAAA